MNRENFVLSEQQCERSFDNNGPFWHLCTPGDNIGILFSDKEEFKYGMNLMALCRLLCSDLEIYTHTLMNNHIHAIVGGKRESCLDFFKEFKKRLQRYLSNKRRMIDLASFECALIPIPDLKSLRSEIIYVNRNGYVVNNKCTPYSYMWGSGIYYFNPLLRHAHALLAKPITASVGRRIFKTRDLIPLEGLLFYDDFALPTTYSSVAKGESMFRNAHHYFNMLTKEWEAYSAISQRLGDKIFLTDDELYGAISSYTLKHYNTNKPSNLSPKDKLSVARVMHFDYHANNRQIRSILRLESSVVQELFPKG